MFYWYFSTLRMCNCSKCDLPMYFEPSLYSYILKKYVYLKEVENPPKRCLGKLLNFFPKKAYKNFISFCYLTNEKISVIVNWSSCRNWQLMYHHYLFILHKHWRYLEFKLYCLSSESIFLTITSKIFTKMEKFLKKNKESWKNNFVLSRTRTDN